MFNSKTIQRIGIICISIIGIAACNNTEEGKSKASISAAEQQIRDAIAHYPDSILLTENLIQYFRENNNYGMAISEAEKAIAKDTTYDRFWDIKSTLLYESNDTLGAIKAMEKAIDLNPQPEYIITIGSMYAQTRNPLALAMADGLLQAPKANAQKEALFIKGLYYNYSGEKQKAIGYFDECIKIDYTNVFAYREKSICLYDLNQFQAATEVLKKAIVLQSSFAEGYYWLGKCYEKLNQRNDAIAHYQQALQLDSEYVEAKDALAKMGATTP
jgi:tetratricopeptide (TPR) repeat protein